MLVASQEPDLFTGMTMVAPFFRLASGPQIMFDNLMPFAKVANKMAPTYKLSVQKPKNKPWLNHWVDDPLIESYNVSPHNLVQMTETTEIILSEFLPKVRTPFLMINAGQDTIVSAKTAE